MVGRKARTARGSSTAGNVAGRGGERAPRAVRDSVGGSDLGRGHAEVRRGRRRVRAAAASVHRSGLVAALERGAGRGDGDARSKGRAFLRVPACGAVFGPGEGAVGPAAPRAQALADPGRRRVRAAHEGAPRRAPRSRSSGSTRARSTSPSTGRRRPSTTGHPCLTGEKTFDECGIAHMDYWYPRETPGSGCAAGTRSPTSTRPTGWRRRCAARGR